MKTILYARVSDPSQEVAHQKTQAEEAGFAIDEVVIDDGVSGVTVPLRERPEGKRLFDLLRRGDMLVVRWLDRLGRNYCDVCDTVRTFMTKGVIVQTVINRMRFDGSTTDPMQMAVRDALLSFMAATAQAQAEATKAAQQAGIAHAKAAGGRYLGRKPSFDRAQFEAVLAALSEGKGHSIIARQIHLSRQAVYRIEANPALVEKSLLAWGM